MANYHQELAQDAVCQSHTGHMIGLWFLPARPLRLNTNERIRSVRLLLLNKKLPISNSEIYVKWSHRENKAPQDTRFYEVSSFRSK